MKCKEIKICGRPEIVNEDYVKIGLEINSELWRISVVYMREREGSRYERHWEENTIKNRERKH